MDASLKSRPNFAGALEFKEDFEGARARWAAFWKGQNQRPIVSIVLPRPGVEPVEYPPYLSWWDGNFPPILDRIEAWAETHEFLGDAVPFAYVEWGPDTFAGFLGADLKLGTGTAWSLPFVEDWNRTRIEFRREGVWWQKTLEFFHAFRGRFDDRLLINPPTLVANLDCLAAIRGIERLLLDLTEHPETIQRVLDDVCRVHDEVLDAYAAELDFAKYGSVNVGGMYSAGRQSRPQCDMSCMISPAMFREFVIPCLEREARTVDAMDYHLDGPGAIQHLEALSGIARLHTISFVPGAGNDGRDWSEVYRKIDACGKGQTRAVGKREARRLWSESRSPKQFFQVTDLSSRAEAEDFLAELESLPEATPMGTNASRPC